MAKPAKKRGSRRNAELAKIHILKHKIGLDDADYRDLLVTHGGCNSAGDMTANQRRAVLDYMVHIAQPTAPKASQYPHRPSDMAEPYLKKIEAYLAEAGRPWGYADGIARRMFSIDKVQWCNPTQLRKVMLALKYEAMRHNRDI